jgi:hypothetical protein
MKLGKPFQNFLIGICSFIAFVVMAATGFLMRFTLPPGSGRGAMVLGLDRHDWGGLHFWASVILMGLLMIHLVLHWRWIVAMVKGRKAETTALRVTLSVVGVVLLALLLLAPFGVPVERTASAGGHEAREVVSREASPSVECDLPETFIATPPPNHSGNRGKDIRGEMTLAQVSGATGVPVAILVERLNLPPDVEPSETVGRLGRRYGFSMTTLRELCASYER